MPFYCCPTCQARSRFNIIQQVATPVKINFQTGESQVMEQLDPFHMPYRGPEVRVQCGSCGTVEDEIRFTKMAENLR
jgi:hypothetical protein